MGATGTSSNISNGSTSSNVRLGDEVTWSGRSYTVVASSGEQVRLRPTSEVDDNAFDSTVGYNDVMLAQSQLRRG